MRSAGTQQDTFTLACCVLRALPNNTQNSLSLLDNVVLHDHTQLLNYARGYNESMPSPPTNQLVVSPPVVTAPDGPDFPVVQVLQAVTAALQVLNTLGGWTGQANRAGHACRGRGRG